VFAGTTAGDINVWLLTQNRDGEIESSSGPVVTLKAHTMGTNCVKASIFGEYSTDNLSVVEVLILSGGDDQALSSNLLSVSLLLSPDEAQVKIDSLVSFTKKEACASAIKGICLVGNQSSGFRVYTTGYDQRVAMWSILIDKIDSSYRMTLHLLTSAPVDIKDVNTIAGCTICCQNDMNTKEYIVAGGEGLEILTFDNCIWDTASALKKCDRLLITCGAGFGADSGLATYESMPDEYRSLCNPMRLVDSLESYQQFWLKFAFEYQIASPHLGYTVLENLCVGGKLKHLNHDGNSSSSLSPWWIYSSNVDGHFGLFDCFKNTICEIHGRASEFRCAHGSGFNNAVKRCGNTWEKWNNHCSGYESNEVCKNSRVDVASLKNKSAPLLCPECKLELRPNVLMFHDTDENILRDIDESRQKYQQWEALVEERVVHNGERLVVLELGAGKNVTAVRDESEEVFRDIVERLQQSNSKGHVTLIRINPKDLSSDLKQSKSSKDFSVIQIPQKAAHALLSIQQALG
jgi:NAD-dependent SIR2 family protein deacetylase